MRIIILLVSITILLFLLHSKNRILNTSLTIIKILSLLFTLFICIKMYVIDIYVVPSGSMRTTIDIGDHILAHKTKINKDKTLNRICVFHSPYNKAKDIFVKRCVALPGDTVYLKNNNVYVNGKIRQEVETCRWLFKYDKQNMNIDSISNVLKRNVKVQKSSTGTPEILLSYGESKKLSLNLSTRVVENIQNQRKDNMAPLYVPQKGDKIFITKKNSKNLFRIIKEEVPNVYYSDSCIYKKKKPLKEYIMKHDCYFMMGDERHFSYDSRFYGPVSDANFIGYVFKIIK